MMYRFPRFPGGRDRAFTASYDDNLTFDRPMLEIMERYGIKCTLNINDAFLTDDQAHRLPPEDTRALVDAGGHEIAQHCDHHIAPGLTSPCTVMREVLEGRQGLERRFDRIVRGMAYPDSGIREIGRGIRYETIRRILQDAGVVYARSLGGDNDRFQLPTDWYNWIPTAHHDHPQILEWIDAFLSADLAQKPSKGQAPLLFYMWGHSYEFNTHQNWAHLEEICRRVGGHDAVWYATNIEIYDYLAAYAALIFNVDETKVYNPGRMPVWFVADKQPYCVQPGETIHL